MTEPHEFLLTEANAPYLTDLYERFLADPEAVDPKWAAVFSELDEGRGRAPPAIPSPASVQRPGASTAPVDPEVRRATLDSIRALMIIRLYRVRGHLIARLDPLGLDGKKYHSELDPKNWGFREEDLDRPIFINQVLGLETASLRQILQILRETYCGSVGVEFMHMQDPEAKAWIQERIENRGNKAELSDRGRRTLLERLTQAEGFERFLHQKYPGTKRFGLDGAESMIPAVEEILKQGAELGIREVNLGMSHRGRLNVLVNIMHKPYRAVLAEFQDVSLHPHEVQGSGDVKYHLGTSSERLFGAQTIHLSLSANPSHLEAVNPVVLGKTRAKQTQRGDVLGNEVMAVLLHGDAAFAGQGLAAECFALSDLEGYRTGGTIHFIVNNQIGFTTSPVYSRSSPYPSDVAKTVQAPIFHVNGDDPESVMNVARIATEFRQRFKRDAVIDMFCYRRFGHNEADEPAFTQPKMYRAIARQPTTRALYAGKLIAQGVIAAAEADRLVREFNSHLEREFEAAAHYDAEKADWLQGRWEGLKTLAGEEELRDANTGASLDLLHRIGHSIARPPADFRLHPRLLRWLETKRTMIENGSGIDWATAEALAFGTLLAEGVPVRLSGQDSGRGTFSQRHAVLVDQDDERRYVPLNHIVAGQAAFEVIDSPLSEASVLGFEYGYSLADPGALVIWEAQFGDFANGAQVIIDQFISSAESKWLRLSGLLLLLPHGYDGQGPEHSSARPERFLQLCAEGNLQVVNCTTPANYFHVLRRQICRNFRKPLVLLSPKSLLRHKLAVSELAAMGPGTAFRTVLPETDALVADPEIRRVVLCSGKIYYELLEERRRRGLEHLALVRIEQLYPLPHQAILQQIARYSKAEVLWCQEEPANMGAWSFMLPRLIQILSELQRAQRLPGYAGREAAASPATGLLDQHREQQARLIHQTLAGEISSVSKRACRVRR